MRWGCRVTAAFCFLACAVWLTIVMRNRPEPAQTEAPQAPTKITIACFYNGCTAEFDESTEAGRLAVAHCKLQGFAFRERV